MSRVVKWSLVFSVGVLAVGAGSWASSLADIGRTLTVAQMVFLHDVPYATSYGIQIAPGYSSGGATIYKFSGSAYFAGDLDKLTVMGFDLAHAAGRFVFGGIALANVLVVSPALALAHGPLMVEGRHDLGSFGNSSQYLMLDSAQGAAHGHIYVEAVAPAINMIGDVTAPLSVTATYEKGHVMGLVQHGKELTAHFKFRLRSRDPRDPKLEGSVYVQNLTLTVFSQTQWTFSGEIVSALHVDP